MGLFENIAQSNGIPYQAFDAEGDALKPRKIAEQVITEIAHRIGVENFKSAFVDTRHGPFNLIASSGRYQINIPPIYLLKREDIPFTSADDPALRMGKDLQKFSDKICAKFGLLHKKVTKEDCMSLRLFLKTMENPEMAVNALVFVILHELGHIFHEHELKMKLYQQELKESHFPAINSLTGGIFDELALLKETRKHEKRLMLSPVKMLLRKGKKAEYIYSNA